MSGNTSIHYLMLKNHNSIDGIVSKLRSALEDNQLLIKKFFSELRTTLEHHFVIEEQAIFTFTEVHNQETRTVIHELLIEHGQMREQMNRLEMQIENSQSVDINPLASLLNEHQRKENEVFYPKLDRDLNDSEKNYIIKKIELISEKSS